MFKPIRTKLKRGSSSQVVSAPSDSVLSAWLRIAGVPAIKAGSLRFPWIHPVHPDPFGVRRTFIDESTALTNWAIGPISNR